ncbi:MAG: nucleoside recognition protein, partial [Clostridia bacterium]|nr:nucleoside recognition protein [Clostridia bacterium]
MNTPGTVAAQQAKRSLLEEFIFGAKNGFYLGVEKIIPAMILAYVLILFLKITG